MKKFIYLLFIFFFTMSCSNKSEKNVNIFLENIKVKNIDVAKKYLENPEILDKIDLNYKTEVQKKFFEKLFENFKYEILNTTTREDGNEVINVKLENIDVAEIFDSTFKRIFRKTFSGTSNLKLENEFKESLNEEKLPLKSNISQFLITKNKKILLRNENIDYIFGGYFSSLNER